MFIKTLSELKQKGYSLLRKREIELIGSTKGSMWIKFKNGYMLCNTIQVYDETGENWIGETLEIPEFNWKYTIQCRGFSKSVRPWIYTYNGYVLDVYDFSDVELS